MGIQEHTMPVQTVFENLEAGMFPSMRSPKHLMYRLTKSKRYFTLPARAWKSRRLSDEILFDNGVPKPIARSLVGHEISYARKIGWHELKTATSF